MRSWLLQGVSAILLIQGILCAQNVNALPKLGYVEVPQNKGDSVSLKSWLNSFSKTHNISFAYSSKLLNGKQVRLDLEPARTVAELSEQLKTFHLRLVQTGDGQYIIEADLPSPRNKDSVTPTGLHETVFQAVTGVVTDEKGTPLEGVSVKILGTNEGVSTGKDGVFRIDAKSGDQLEFTSIGYAKKIIALVDNRDLRVSLIAVNANLSEVIVVGYGTQRKANITGSVATVSSASLNDRPLTNSSQALQGASGVYVNQTSGQPGADDATIRIRGVGTLNNNDPLVLVDGIAYNMHDVNPDDIESISILKDAASAAIYGNRAANGVILIKTKSGKKGRTMLEYSNYFGFQQVTYLPDAVTNSAEYAQLYNQALTNQGTPLNPGVNSFSAAQIDSFKVNVGKQSNVYPSNNWFDIMFRKAFIQQHNLRFSGGGEKSSYFVSVGYMSQDGVMIGTGAQKYSLTSNLSFDAAKNLTIGVNLNGDYWLQQQPPLGGITNMMNAVMRALPFQNAVLSNGQYADQWIKLNGQNVFRNPYALATNGFDNTNTSNILANAYAEYKLPFRLTYKADVAVTKSDAYSNIYTPSVQFYNPITFLPNPSPLDYNGLGGGLPNSASRADANNINTTFFQTLTWVATLAEKHNVNALVGTSAETYNSYTTNASAAGIIDNNVTELSNGTNNQTVSSSTTVNKLASYFGRAGYNYAERYLLEFDFRYDGSSNFASDKRWGFFPSASAGWRIDQEKFFEGLRKTVPALKLRGSWGQLGNQNVPPFSYLTTYSNTVLQGYTFGSNPTGTGGTPVVGAATTALANPNISWERTTTTNFGLDASFLSNKLSVTADYFNRLTTGILTPIIIPAQIGNLTGPTENLYSIRNAGVEIGASYGNKIGKLSYRLSGNFSSLDNKVVNLEGQQQINGLNIIKQGYSVNAFYLLKATGIFQTKSQIAEHAYQGPATSPGDLIYQPQNGDTTITPNDRIVTGRSIPKYMYSFTVNLNCVGFDLAAFFQGVADVNTYPTLNLAQPFYNGAGITKEWATDSWTPTNTKASLPRLTTVNGYQQNFQGIAGSTFWLKNASYLRLKNLQVGYSLSPKLLGRYGISRLRIFANAQNFLTFSKFKEFDPERVLTQTNLYSYPSVKVFTGGLNISF